MLYSSSHFPFSCSSSLIISSPFYFVLLLTSLLSPVSSYQSLSSLYEIIILLFSPPCSLSSKIHLSSFLLPHFSLSCDLLSAILILSYCFLSDVLFRPCVKCTLKKLCAGCLYWYCCQIKGVFHKARNQPLSGASTLLHAYI